MRTPENSRGPYSVQRPMRTVGWLAIAAVGVVTAALAKQCLKEDELENRPAKTEIPELPESPKLPNKQGKPDVVVRLPIHIEANEQISPPKQSETPTPSQEEIPMPPPNSLREACERLWSMDLLEETGAAYDALTGVAHFTPPALHVGFFNFEAITAACRMRIDVLMRLLRRALLQGDARIGREINEYLKSECSRVDLDTSFSAAGKEIACEKLDESMRASCHEKKQKGRLAQQREAMRQTEICTRQKAAEFGLNMIRSENSIQPIEQTISQLLGSLSLILAGSNST